MTSFMALDGITSFLRLKDVTNTCKRMRRGLCIGGSSSVQRWKLEDAERFKICFRTLLCNKIEIDQLQCVICCDLGKKSVSLLSYIIIQNLNPPYITILHSIYTVFDISLDTQSTS